MNNILSQVIFGVGIVLAISALSAIFINSVALENSNKQSSATSQTTIQPVSPNENGTTPTQSSSKTNNVITSINIAKGSAAEQVKQYYNPNPAEISDNSKITWINNDITIHTATASDGSFDTGLIQAGSSESEIVKGEGNVPYGCTIHPWMRASLNIVGSNTKNNTESNIINANSEVLKTNASTTDQSQSKSISIPTVNEHSKETSQTEKPFFFLFNSFLPAFNVTEYPHDQFSLKTLEVNQNDNLTIYFYNMEAPTGDRHSFTINAPYNINLDLGQGKNGSTSFTANEPGIFRYYCQYHQPTMNGQLVVLPNT